MSTAHHKRALCLILTSLVLLGFAVCARAAPLADSVILLIGDGMGSAQVRLAREAAGGAPLAMERMPYSGLITTHSADRPVTDSAAAGTALATGHKTNNGMISVAPDERVLRTILELCRDRGKSTGIITTDALHGATPASFAAHAPSRGMRSEIALQLAESRVPVMLGFWKGWFLPDSEGGERADGKHLIADLRRAGYGVAFTKEELSNVTGQRLLGLFDDGPEAPTLADMTLAALGRLRTDRDGLFLIVEAARIDWKCHHNDPAGAVLDTWEFDRAVAAALDYARGRGRTLVLVTADHETGGLSIEEPGRVKALAGIKAPAADIAEKLNADRSNVAEVLAEYAGVHDLTPDEIAAVKGAEHAADAVSMLLNQRAGLFWSTKGHSDTRVPVFAYGPGAERFAGEMDNTDIPKRIAEVLGIGPFPR